MVINADFPGTEDHEFNVYQTGEPLSITESLEGAMRGYIDVDYINQAVPGILTMMETPGCGVLTKSGTSVTEQSFALFWTYTVENAYTYEIGVGDQVDLS
jgi:hypothetical protein